MSETNTAPPSQTSPQANTQTTNPSTGPGTPPASTKDAIKERLRAGTNPPANTALPGTPPPANDGQPPAEPPKEKLLDGFAKLTKATRQLELDRKAFEDERKGYEPQLTIAKKYEPVEKLMAAGDIRGAMRLIAGPKLADVAFELLEDLAPTQAEPLTEDRAKQLAREEWEALQQAEKDRKAEQDRQLYDRAEAKYVEEIQSLISSSPDAYPSIRARGHIARERLIGIIQREYERTQAAPDPKTVLDEIEAEDRAHFLKTLPYVAAPTQDATARQPSRTLTSSLKQGATPPEPTTANTAEQSREQRKARLRALSLNSQ